MEIKKVFNSTINEIESRKFNIFIGISLGNKWFTKENLREYLHLALDYTRGKVLFLIADKLQSINYDVRNKDRSEYNLKRALKKGIKIKKIIEELILELPKEQRDKIKILQWEEYEKLGEFYKKYTPLVYESFEEDNLFRKEILTMMKSLITDRTFSEKEYLEFSKYLLEEITLSYLGIKYNSDYYGLYFYPQESPLHDFLINVQKDKAFADFNKKLSDKRVALVIIN